MRKIGDFVHYVSLPGVEQADKKRCSASETRFRGALTMAITLHFREEIRRI